MKQRILIWLRNFFGFSRSEANGFIILLLLMILVLFLPVAYKKTLYHFKRPLQTEQDKKHLNDLLAKLDSVSTINENSYTAAKYNPKPFELNSVESIELIEMGFPDYLAERIINYRNKIKEFDNVEELLKIYGMDSSLYFQFKPYISVNPTPKKSISNKVEKFSTEKSNENNNFKNSNYQKAKIIKFDINTADTVQLKKVYGIGPAFAKRIIAYRDLLGGFYSSNQLSEVYGLKSPNLDSLLRRTYIEQSFKPKQLNVNIATAEELAKHPYISSKEARLIVAYRENHIGFQKMEDLLQIKILDSKWLEKTQNYLTLE